MCEYEICPTCGASLDIGEKCTTCNPLITPIPIIPDKGYKAVNDQTQITKGGNSNASSESK